MIRFLFVRLVVPLLVFWLLRSLLKSFFAGFPSAQTHPGPVRQPPPVPAGGELKKDPVCGTYVSAATSMSRTVKGTTVYFCSVECRDRYRG